jgi:chromosome segregation ATPase
MSASHYNLGTFGSVQQPSFFAPLIEAFQKGIHQIQTDSLLDCFKQNSESQKYMFDRMKEILNESIKSGVDGVTSALEKCTHHGNFTGSILDSAASDDSGYYHQLTKASGYDDRMSNEKTMKSQKSRITELADTVAQLRENEKTLKLKYEAKSKGLEEMRDRLAGLERELKKSQYEKREMEEIVTRKCKLLEEENSILRAKFSELHVGFEKVSQENDLREMLKALECKYQEVKDINKSTNRKLEESEFANEQLKLSVGSLKQEIHQLNDLLKAERNANYSLELKLIEMKEKEAEMRITANDFRDKLSKCQNEHKSLLAALSVAEDSLKSEKKRSIELERINEQLTFTMVNTERNLKDRVDVTTMKLNKVTEENERLKERLDGLSRDQRSHVEEERKNFAKLSEK